MDKEKEFTKDYYEHRIASAGEDYLIVGWESAEAQKARFEVMCKNIPLEGMKILDVGCGVGSFLRHMEDRGIHADYTGIDILSGMIEEAKKRHPGGKFLVGDVLTDVVFHPLSFDVIVSSGLFNLNIGNNRQFLSDAFEHFCVLSRSYVALNFLHVHSPDREDKYIYYHPDEVRDLVLQLAPEKPEITIIEEYLPNDFTVICKKQA